MKLLVKKVNIDAGEPLIALLHKEDAKRLDVDPLDRIRITFKKKQIVAVVDTTSDKKSIKPGEIGLFKELAEILKVKTKNKIEVKYENKPESLIYIKKKLNKKELTKQEINTIIKDIVDNSLTEIETTYFVSACYNHGLSEKEVLYLTKAFVNNSKSLKFKKEIILDKHCLGGVPNNRTTMIIIPIIASLGYTIPKTSSRSITSPAGTADTMEVLAPIKFSNKEIKKIIKKTNGCMVWGGTSELASADDKIIKIEKPLNLDPFLLPSIIGKKIAAGATHVLIDIPYGKGSKIPSLKQAKDLSQQFKRLSKKLSLKTKVIITDGSHPIGKGIGPALEAIDVLNVLQNKGPKDLRKKSITMATILLKMAGIKNAKKKVETSLKTGLAYKKMLNIIKAQKGNPNKKIKLGEFTYKVKSSKTGKIISINNKIISRIAKFAGAPTDKGAGIYLYKKVTEKVTKGETIFTIYAENKNRLKSAIKILKKEHPYLIR